MNEYSVGVDSCIDNDHHPWSLVENLCLSRYYGPTGEPTLDPTIMPSGQPTMEPTTNPTNNPTTNTTETDSSEDESASKRSEMIGIGLVSFLMFVLQ